MQNRNIVERTYIKIVEKWFDVSGKATSNSSSKHYRFKGSNAEIAQDIQEKYGFSGDLLTIFETASDLLIHKWHHYIPLYDRYFQKWRGTPVRFLEIGVSKGGSLTMWRRYLGEDAIIFGIDIDPSCAQFDGIDGQVRIGSQADPEFLRGIVAEMGGIDVVLDDGSHQMAHIKASLDVLFPLCSEGGIYMIEDLHTSYWARFGGGLRSGANFFALVRGVIDDMHGWYHFGWKRYPQIAQGCTGVHVHDSICVLDRGATFAPSNSMLSCSADTL